MLHGNRWSVITAVQRFVFTISACVVVNARLFDLIQVKNAAHAKAFYFAVQDTLVATDMDQALR